jgi:hypothetical protein
VLADRADLVCNETVGIAVDAHRSVSAGGVNDAEHSSLVLVDPVALIPDAVLLLGC